MRAVFILCTTIVLITLCVVKAVDDVDAETQWNDFKVQFNRTYATEEEAANRKTIFLDTLDFIQKHNKKYDNGEVSYTLGINGFADWTEDEFKRLRGKRLPTPT